MASGIVTSLFLVAAALRFAPSCAAASAEDEGACEASPGRTKGPQAALVQRNVVTLREPELTLPLTTQISDLEKREDTLEAESGKGLEDLKSELELLQKGVSTMKGSLDDTVARVGTAEGMITSLESAVDTQNAGFRTGIGLLRTKFATLGKKVGGQFASMIQLAAKESPTGQTMTDRISTLEARVAAQEEVSGQKRTDIKDELVALKKLVDEIRTGGVDSLEHTTQRVTSAAKQLQSLQGAADSQNEEIKSDLMALHGNTQDLSKKVGLSMLQQHNVADAALPEWKLARAKVTEASATSAPEPQAALEVTTKSAGEVLAEKFLAEQDVPVPANTMPEWKLARATVQGVSRSPELEASATSAPEPQAALEVTTKSAGEVLAEKFIAEQDVPVPANTMPAWKLARATVQGVSPAEFESRAEAGTAAAEAPAEQLLTEQDVSVPANTLPAWKMARAMVQGSEVESRAEVAPKEKPSTEQDVPVPANTMPAWKLARSTVQGESRLPGFEASAEVKTPDSAGATSATAAPAELATTEVETPATAVTMSATAAPAESAKSSVSLRQDAPAHAGATLATAAPAATADAAPVAAADAAQAQSAPGGGGGNMATTAGLPLTSRLASLAKRVEQLEDKSGNGRLDLISALEALKDTVEATKEGGTASLAHTVLMEADAEKQITAVQSLVEEYKSSLTASIADVTAEVDNLDGRVGQ